MHAHRTRYEDNDCRTRMGVRTVTVQTGCEDSDYTDWVQGQWLYRLGVRIVTVQIGCEDSDCTDWVRG